MAKLLNIDANAKTKKGQKLGYVTGVLYLAPADEAQSAVDADPELRGRKINLCVNAGNCKGTCLFRKGRPEFDPHIIEARIRKTLWMLKDPVGFEAQLDADIQELIRKGERENLIPVVRLNGTTDLPKLARKFAQKYPQIQFYDYTKLDRPWQRELPNYHLTFSFDGDNTNVDASMDALAHGFNLAVVFDTEKGDALPETWRGYKVVDGDVSDLRFLDGHQALIIGLRQKGQKRNRIAGSEHGFVQLSALTAATV